MAASRFRSALIVVLAPAMPALSACATLPRLPAPPAGATAAPPGFSGEVRSLGTDRRFTDAAAEARIRSLRSAATDGRLDILAISGGGASGAFSAGALIGLRERGERPGYEVVTGVSAGALVAPFAFLGPEWDPALRAALTGEHVRGLMRPHGPLALGRASLFSGKPLRKLVERFVTPGLVEAVARETRSGRMLLVATSDLDREETVIWDMGLIARRADAAAVELFRDVLVASASVPGLLPPVLLPVVVDGRTYAEMHVDGGATTPFFIAPEIAHFKDRPLAGLCGANVHVLVNGELEVPVSSTPLSTIPITGRGLDALMMHMTRTAISTSWSFARRHKTALHVATIRTGDPQPDWLEFRPEKMRALFEAGRRRALEGSLWDELGEREPPPATAAACSGSGGDGE